MAIKDAWRFDKSQWALKAGIASALVLATIAWYARELMPAGLECNDQTLLVFGVVYVARLYFAMLVLWSRPPTAQIPSSTSSFRPPARWRKARLAVARRRAAVGVALYAGRSFSAIGEYQRHVFQETARRARPTHDDGALGADDARQPFRRHAPVHGVDARVDGLAVSHGGRCP